MWRKAWRSSFEGNCVEVDDSVPGTVRMRDSKDPQGPVLEFDTDVFRGLIDDFKAGRLVRP